MIRLQLSFSILRLIELQTSFSIFLRIGFSGLAYHSFNSHLLFLQWLLYLQCKPRSSSCSHLRCSLQDIAGRTQPGHHEEVYQRGEKLWAWTDLSERELLVTNSGSPGCGWGTSSFHHLSPCVLGKERAARRRRRSWEMWNNALETAIANPVTFSWSGAEYE